MIGLIDSGLALMDFLILKKNRVGENPMETPTA
jgi:hypothetical protein